MSEQKRPAIDRVWEFTKDISAKVSKQAEKHWKINSLRVQIASMKHRKSNSCRELGRFVYESLKSNTIEEQSYKTALEGFYEEIQELDNEIEEREKRVEALSSEPVVEEDLSVEKESDFSAEKEADKEEAESSEETEPEVIEAEPVSAEPEEKKDKVQESE